jgi:hypothetical protein
LIEQVKKDYYHILYKGSLATVDVNAPGALMQHKGWTILKTLYWVLGEKFKHEYPRKGNNT